MIAWTNRDNPSADRVECFIATGTAAVIAAITAAGASTAKGVMDSRAAKNAAAIQAQASDKAVTAQTTATDKALDFQKQQADLDAQRAEANRRGDYDSWAARERRVGTLGQMLGLPAREVPDYVPMPGTLQPSGSPQSSRTSANLMPTQGEVDWNAPPDQLSQQLAAYYTKRGAAPSEVPYWVQHAQELVQRGQELNDPGYADKRLSQSEIFGGGGGQSKAPTAARTAMPGTLGYMTPAYQAPRSPLPGTLGASF